MLRSSLPIKGFISYLAMVLAVVIGGGSLLLFGVFLLIGPIPVIRFDASEHLILLWNASLSILFFIQHSGMVRASFRARLVHIIPPHYHPAIYSIASGIALSPSRVIMASLKVRDLPQWQSCLNFKDMVLALSWFKQE